MTTKVMIRSLVCNTVLTIIKLVASIFSNSKTLLADAVHCFSDLSTDIVGLVGSKLSVKKPDELHPFGHGKIEYVTSIIISMFIIVLGFTIFKSSFVPRNTMNILIGLIVLIITIIIKFILSSYLLKEGKKLNSNILVCSSIESRYDTLFSLFSCIILIITYFGKYFKPLYYADIIGSITISIFTIKIGIKLLISNIKSVIGQREDNKELNDNISNITLSFDKVKSIKRITIIKYGYYYKVDIDIIVNKSLTLKKLYSLEQDIKYDLKKYNKNLRYITINMIP
ncbi:MAG: cation diffusion facilitator family transporter [Bacilli bacterium]